MRRATHTPCVSEHPNPRKPDIHTLPADRRDAMSIEMEKTCSSKRIYRGLPTIVLFVVVASSSPRHQRLRLMRSRAFMLPKCSIRRRVPLQSRDFSSASAASRRRRAAATRGRSAARRPGPPPAPSRSRPLRAAMAPMLALDPTSVCAARFASPGRRARARTRDPRRPAACCARSSRPVRARASRRPWSLRGSGSTEISLPLGVARSAAARPERGRMTCRPVRVPIAGA